MKNGSKGVSEVFICTWTIYILRLMLIDLWRRRRDQTKMSYINRDFEMKILLDYFYTVSHRPRIYNLGLKAEVTGDPNHTLIEHLLNRLMPRSRHPDYWKNKFQLSFFWIKVQCKEAEESPF